MTEAKNIHQRLAAAMGDVTYIQKEKKQGMQYTIVSHDAVTAKVRPVLLKHGIVYYPTSVDHTQNGNRAECAMTVRFVNIDAPDDYFEVQTFGYGVDNQDKGPGKAMSYAVKYALLKALGLETGDDADHDSIPHETKDPSETPPDPQPAIDYLKEAETLSDLRDKWSKLPKATQAIDAVIKAKDERKADLAEAEHDAAVKEEAQ